ncbi:sensor histidine kinase [Sphingobacterium sp. MYb382]|uniref:sensor histidine kinase n=1 Tax=Sphingobacterium sp. MYb382 TaxID=2745278 RepID=UPI0030B444B9
MRIKTKLNIGVGILFLMILTLAALSGLYVTQLKRDTNNILAANYNTLQYARSMLLALEDVGQDAAAFNRFQLSLDKQKLNATEKGEDAVTAQLAQHFAQLKASPDDNSAISSIRRDLSELMRLNMEAIERKSDVADNTAENAILVISVTGTLCFMVAFILLVNLPSNIANPIRELTASIKEIAGQNYKKRVYFKGGNEFGDLAQSFNTMAEKLEEYAESKLEKILQGKKRIETLIDNLHDPVIGIDEHGKVLFANEEALTISGLKKIDFVGQQIQNVALKNDLIRDISKDIFHPKEKNAKVEALKIYADGKESYFEKDVVAINVVPTGEQEAKFIGQVILLRNITPFKELDLAKTNFMGTISHEFKTPIASIQMSMQLLENERTGALNSEQRELLQGVKEDTKRLLAITAELLNVTQLESGLIQIKMLSVPVKPIIDYAVQANKVAAEQKGISLNLHMDNAVTNVQADSEKTAWVLTNLISNAIRYSHDHAVVDLDVEFLEGRTIRFTVRDHGQGIQHEFLDKIFERYFRVPGTKKEGTGLGLSISKEFMEAQGGQIGVESEFGVGSTFFFTLAC